MTTRSTKKSAPRARSSTRGLARRIEIWPIEQLRPYEKNPRTHGDEQVALLAQSMKQHGFTNPILVAAERIVAGHGRLLAARRLGLTHVPVIPLKGMTELDAQQYRLLDNKLAELSSWDAQLLVDELDVLAKSGVLSEQLGFDADDLERLTRELAAAGTLELDERDDAAAPAAASVEAPTAPAKRAIARPGDVWLLGRHRFVVGEDLGDGVLRRARSLRNADSMLERWRMLVGREPVLEGGGKLSEERARRGNAS